MVSQRLISYIKEDLKSHDKEEIKKILVEQGYPEELADNAIKAAVEACKQEKEVEGKKEVKEKQGIKELKEERESRKEQLKVKSEQTKKKLEGLKKKTVEKARKNSKLLIFILVILILGIGFFGFRDFFNDWFYNIKNERSLVLDLNFEDYYLINGNSTVIKDNSKYGNDGVLKGDAKLIDTDFGKAVELDGSGYVDIGTITTDFSTGFTYSAWVYINSVKTWARFIDLSEGGNANDNIVFTRYSNTNDLTYVVYVGRTNGGEVTTSTSPLTIGSWMHLAATEDSSGNVIIYKNGIPIKTGTTGIPTVVNRADSFIGKSNWVVDQYFNGTIDQVKIYNRPLSQAEISYLYNKSRK